MKKTIIYLVVIIAAFLIATFIGNKIYYNFIKVDKEREFYETPEIKENKNALENYYIKETDEMITRGLFEYMNDNSYENNLMANDMTWNQESGLYHKVITTMEDYDIYNIRIGLPKITEEDLKTKSVIIVASENVRDVYERDLHIAEIVVEENISHIILKQKENPNLDCKNNVFVAIVENEMLKENAVVEIK